MSTYVKQADRDGIARHTVGTPRDRPDDPALPTEIVPRYRWYLNCKVALDLVAAFLLLIPCLPVIALAAVCVKLTSRGPAFYSQTRVGLDGKTFRIYKLRTMREDAEAETGAVWSSTNDPRITPLGKLLRELHIDEFPQLLNVLMCQMSLIGPRPERPEFVDSLEWKIPEYRLRLTVRPGVTGIAQLNLPPDTDLESVRKKLVHDVYYIRYCSPWLDAKIVYFTGWMLFTSIFMWTLRLFLIPGRDEVTSEVAKLAHAESQLRGESENLPESRSKTPQMISVMAVED